MLTFYEVRDDLTIQKSDQLMPMLTLGLKKKESLLAGEAVEADADPKDRLGKTISSGPSLSSFYEAGCSKTVKGNIHLLPCCRRCRSLALL